jgi:RNA polymerase sigma-70 factor (ECF subfamily)
VAGAESKPTRGPADLTGLIQAARGGDERAWTELVTEYGPRVFALARSRLRDQDAAEEVTQSVFATIAIKIRDGQYDEHGKFEPWLFRIAMNRVRDAVRRNRRDRSEQRRRMGARAEVNEPARDGEGGGHEPLRRAIASLSAADRNIVELRYHAELSFRQIADLLGEPIGTLLARHHRALRKLQRLLEADGKADAETVVRITTGDGVE